MASIADNSHLCSNCRRVMCRDCKDIATEYPELLQRYKAALYKAEQERDAAQQELQIVRRTVADYDRILKLGVGAQVVAWMESLSSTQLVTACERAAKKIEG